MPLQEHRSLARGDKCGGGKRARRMPGHRDRPPCRRKKAQHRIRLGQGDRGPGRRFERIAQPVHQMARRIHDQNARAMVTTTARPLPM
jgi:hypothetical protein